MKREMIWVTKGGRPCKNKPDMEVLKRETETMSVEQLMAKYGVSQATMYRYIKEAKQDKAAPIDYSVDENMTLEEALKENAALKAQIARLNEYIRKMK